MTLNQRIALSRYRRCQSSIVGPVCQDIRDYAPPIMGRDYASPSRTTDPAKPRPMAVRERRADSHAILASAIVLMLALIALAVLG